MVTYQQRQLPSFPEAIRVLRVHKQATENSLIECSLHDASIATTKYIALSYVWGTDLPTYKILLDGVDVFVRPNLWCFLEYARNTLSGENLWVDSLCINQADEKEKNIQVALMGRIYTQAVQVRTWLNGQRSVFTAVEGLASGASLLVAAIRDPALRESNRRNASQILPAMARLAVHEYWSRAWIVQELLLAKAALLIWEGHEIAWNDLVCFFEHNFRLSNDHPTFETHFSSYLDTIHNRSFDELAFFGILSYARSGNLERKPSLIDVMLTFQYQQASNFHDQVFAFVGLADMAGRAPFKIDYKDSAAELWCRIVYAAANLPSESKMKTLAQLMHVNSEEVSVPAAHQWGNFRPHIEDHSRVPFPRLCPNCYDVYGDSRRISIIAIPGSRSAIVFANRPYDLLRFPVWAIVWQEDDAASAPTIHRDEMLALDSMANSSGLKFILAPEYDTQEPCLMISGTSTHIQEWIRSPPAPRQFVKCLLILVCQTKHDSSPEDCSQHFRDTALPLNTKHDFMNILAIPASKLYGTLDLGHWKTSYGWSRHIFILVRRGESVFELAAKIVSELAQVLSKPHGGRHGQRRQDVWLADCPRSMKSSRSDVLRLIEWCRQACWDNGGSQLDIDRYDEGV